ncbi:MAG: hypothetical protein K9J37_18870 [Saprospiraceae bacterium]|nr:hypothetical protein [Saprospiraceae bacterium]MCF8251986.1 hypothetical protein [Saprospiraceae bacterium]MCF8281679.1 hypothetical protein [Bacteroidales bacterium]MCF8313667.1 hypothetical protein [Saprospiraceae bacterium]MCF8442374.1 hypothetical protein [Saprospiraceae bacterium]
MTSNWPSISAACLLLLLPQCLLSQKSEQHVAFEHLLESAGLEFFEPLDAGYRTIQPQENDYLNCQYAINSNREHLEIRYYVQPWNEADANTTAPHVSTFRVLTSVATNAGEAVISAIQPTKETLLRDFNADWGMTYFFTPKPAFSDKPACKLLALSREGQGTVFVFFLFNDPGNEALNQREVAVRFK